MGMAMLGDEARRTGAEQIANDLLRLKSSDFVLEATRTSLLRLPSNRHRLAVPCTPFTKSLVATP